jgi:hypothetical protein
MQETTSEGSGPHEHHGILDRLGEVGRHIAGVRGLSPGVVDAMVPSDPSVRSPAEQYDALHTSNVLSGADVLAAIRRHRLRPLGDAAAQDAPLPAEE